eukprot:15364590-Ditylum_brightwellii.AAC.1
MTLIFSLLVSLPAECNYFSSDLLGQPFLSAFFSYKYFVQIKTCFSVANPTEEENQNDKLAKSQIILNRVQEVSQQYWIIGKDIGLDKSQAWCGSRYAGCLHQGETKKPIAIYVKITASHCTNSGFNYVFHVSTYIYTVTDMLLDVCKRIPWIMDLPALQLTHFTPH